MTKDLKIKHLKEKVSFQAAQIRKYENAVRELGQQCNDLRRELRQARNGAK